MARRPAGTGSGGLPKSAADCGLRGVRKGSQTYVFFGSEGDDGQVLALSNQGTREADNRTVRRLNQLTGVQAQEPVSPSAEEPEVSTTPTVLDDSEAPSVMESITVPVVVVLVGLVVFGIGAFLGRRPR